MTEPKKGDIVYHLRTKVKWRIIEVNEQKYRTSVKMKSCNDGRLHTKDWLNMSDYRLVGYVEPKDPTKRHKHNELYTNKDLAYMCKNYGKLSNDQIGLMIGRDKTCVAMKVCALKKSGLFERYAK